MTLRCVIVDDSAGFLRSARRLLEREGVEVVAVASTGPEALQRAEELRPDVMLLDIGLGEESGFDLARRLETEAKVPLRVILISTHAEEDFADLIAASPVAGFVAKADLSADTIRRVLGGPDVEGTDGEGRES
jgi:two-component system, NarL family, nitrate/nitrite response regulator NarL